MRWRQKFLAALIVPSPILITLFPGTFNSLTPLSVYKFPNKLAPSVPNDLPRNSPLCSFASFSIVSQRNNTICRPS